VSIDFESEELNQIWERWNNIYKSLNDIAGAKYIISHMYRRINHLEKSINNLFSERILYIENQVEENVTKPLLLCYYIGLDVASGKTNSSDVDTLIEKATSKINDLVLSLTSMLAITGQMSIGEPSVIESEFKSLSIVIGDELYKFGLNKNNQN